MNTNLINERYDECDFYIKDKFYEMPIIIGNVEDEAHSTMTLWLNAELKSWTIVATVDNKTCVVGYGKNFKVISLTR